MPNPNKASLKRASRSQALEPTSKPPQSSSESTVADEGMNNVDDSYNLPQRLTPLTLRDEQDNVDPAETERGEIEALGQHVIDAMGTINKLEGLGLKNLKIDLPKCVVLGAQSAGKSSVIEAISGIKTPRSTDTCTRCPLFISLESARTPDSAWQATVYLRKSFRLDENTSAQGRRFPGWQPLDTECFDIQFAATKNPAALENLIARAQLAILNDKNDPKDYLQDNITGFEDHLQASFSPNCVCIYISGPSLPSLSFFDLPGIIGGVDRIEDSYLVKFVHDLVTDYVKDKDALILVTYSLGDDLSNSSAGTIAHKCKASNRCIGILTKPDCLPAGTKDARLLSILNGQILKLGHGYHVVKNLSQNDIEKGLKHRDARMQEQEFFENTAPWCTTLSSFQHRFGTLNLQNYLSKTLAAQTMTALPKIHAQIEEAIHDIERHMLDYPEPPVHNVVQVVFNILRTFCNHVANEMEGEDGYEAWLNIWGIIQKDFANELAGMRPLLKPIGDLDKNVCKHTSTGASVDDGILIEDDEDDIQCAVHTPVNASPGKKRKLNNGTSGEPSGNAPSTPPAPKDKSAKPETRYGHLAKIFNLDEVTLYLKEKSKSKIPGRVQPKVLDRTIRETVAPWEHPMQDFFDRLEAKLLRHMQKIFDHTFGPWIESDIYGAVWSHVERFLKFHFEQHRTLAVNGALAHERRGPYFFYEDLLDQKTTATRQGYKEVRFKKRKNMHFSWRDDAANRPGSNAAFRENELKKDDKLRLMLEQDPYTKEIDFIADVSAYYAIVSRRFHDAVCMKVKLEFFEALRCDLENQLIAELGIGGEEGHKICTQLLAEPAARKAARDKLILQKNALLKGHEMLRELAAKYDTRSSSTLTRSGTNGPAPTSSIPSASASAPVSEEMADVTYSSQPRS